MAYKRILVPLDGSSTSKAGLREAIELAKGQRATLQLVHVVDQHYIGLMGMESAGGLSEMMDSLKRSGRDILKNAQAAADKAGVKATAVLLETMTGPAADLILRQAKKSGVDLIVLGTHGRRGVRRLLMGSDAEQVVRNAPVPVMLVRAA